MRGFLKWCLFAISVLFVMSIGVCSMIVWASGYSVEIGKMTFSGFWIFSILALITLGFLIVDRVAVWIIREGYDSTHLDSDPSLDGRLEDLIERVEAAEDYSLKLTPLKECRRQLGEFKAIADYFDDIAERYRDSGVVKDTCSSIVLLGGQVDDNAAIILNLYEVILNGGVADSDIRQVERCLNSNQRAIVQAQGLQLAAVRYINSLFHEGGDEQYAEDIANAFNYAMLAKVDQAAVREMDRQVGELNDTMSVVMQKVAAVRRNLNLST